MDYILIVFGIRLTLATSLIPMVDAGVETTDAPVKLEPDMGVTVEDVAPLVKLNVYVVIPVVPWFQQSTIIIL